MKKALAIFLAMLMLLTLFTGCAKKPAESKPEAETPAQTDAAQTETAEPQTKALSDMTFAYVAASTNDYWTRLQEGVRDAAAEAGITVMESITQEGDIPAGVAAVDAAIASGVDGIITIYVRKGEIVGLAGLVGAGRSELVNAIFGKTRLSAGELYKNGQKIQIRSTRDAINQKLALVTEERKTDGFVQNMSICQNMTLASMRKCSRFGFFDRKKERALAQEQFEALNVRAPGIDFRVGNLSGGNQQKVVLAKWLMQDVDVLILDEPTRGIDIGAKTEIYKIMSALVERGVSIIMISSELPELISMSDRVYVLAEGELRGELEGEDITQEAIMNLISNQKRQEEPA